MVVRGHIFHMDSMRPLGHGAVVVFIGHDDNGVRFGHGFLVRNWFIGPPFRLVVSLCRRAVLFWQLLGTDAGHHRNDRL